MKRLAVVVQDVDSIFDVDTLRQAPTRFVRWLVKYKKMRSRMSLSVYLSHIRSVTFMVSDELLSNEGRGVLRRL